MPPRTGGMGVARDPRSPGWIAALVAAIVVLVLLALAPPAQAQIIDQLDVRPKGSDTEIAIRFVTTVQYLRHSPPAKGRLVKVEFRVTGPTDSQIGGRLVTESRSYPGDDAVPPFEVRYVAAQNALTVEFQREVSWRVSGAGDGRTILVRVPLPPGKTAPPPPIARPPAKGAAPAAPATPATPPDGKPPAPSLAPAPEIERDGAAIVGQARKALSEGRAEEAIERLNQALNLPPGAFSAEAQELIGQAREANGETAKARAEYELYLKLYPDNPGAARVRERLAKLGSAPPPGKPERAAKPAETSVYGTFSTTYYRGATKYDATLAPPIPGLQPDQVSLTATDQSSFVTSLDVTGRYQNGPWDNKLVFRNTHTASLISGDQNDNRLAAAYYELNQKERDASLRLGRQSSPGAGVLGRFDGGWARLGITPVVKVNAVGGRTVEYYAAPRRDLYGASVDFGPWDNRLTTSLYAIGQRVDGVVDRQAVGTEMRYFDPTRNGFLLFDYDTKFRQVGTAMLQANWTTAAGTNYAFLYDRRRTPPLQVSNVSSAYSGTSVGDLLDSGISYQDLLQQSKGITPISDLYSIGLTHPFSARWQLGADVKLSRVSGTSAVGQYPAAPPSGNLWVYTVQAIGTGLINSNDVFVASLSLNRAETFDGTSVSVSYVRVIERWRLEAGLKYYGQKDMNDLQLTRWTPNAKAGYRWGEHLTFEGEAGAEISRLRGPTQSEDSRRHYFNIGFRWDFH